MSTETNVDLSLLRSLYSSSDVAKAALDSFATRSNRSSETTVERLLVVLESNSSFKRQDVVGFFQQLQKTNCGSFVIGRRNNPSRFLWSVSLVDVGLAAQGKKSTVQLEVPQTLEITTEPDEISFTHVFQLRSNQRIEFRLPTDLTPHEAARIADFVKTLPIEVS
jgi:hypothetical protein